MITIHVYNHELFGHVFLFYNTFSVIDTWKNIYFPHSDERRNEGTMKNDRKKTTE